MESKLQVSDKGDLLDFSLDGGTATQGDAARTVFPPFPVSWCALWGVVSGLGVWCRVSKPSRCVVMTSSSTPGWNELLGVPVQVVMP